MYNALISYSYECKKFSWQQNQQIITVCATKSAKQILLNVNKMGKINTRM